MNQNKSMSVLVTGSSRGIGKAIALRLARDGYDVVLHCRSQRAEADAVAQEIEAMGRAARVLQFDIGDRAATAAALEADMSSSTAAITAWSATPASPATTRSRPCPARTGTSCCTPTWTASTTCSIP
jgi:NAD(P)-dependent dehydrogenase (short-subunit alcohol dehydrogenase family)